MSTLPGTPFITINGGSQQTVPLISNDDLLNNAYVAVFTNTSGNYNFAGNSYTGYFKFQGMETAENSVYIIAVGGGGGGGGTQGNANLDQNNQMLNGSGQGGGGGGTCLFWFNQLDPAYTYAVNVGVGGGGCNSQGGDGGDTTIDCYDITSNGSYNLQYNLMKACGGTGGMPNSATGSGKTTGSTPGGGSTGIPNWGSYPYNSNPTYNDIGIGCGFTGGNGSCGQSPGNSTFPQLTNISNGLATTYNNELPWINTLIDNIGPLQNWYGGGGNQGGSSTIGGAQGSSGGNYGYGGGSTSNGGGTYACGYNGASYGDAGGGAYWYEKKSGLEYRWFEATGGCGIQGCVIVVMIPGYSSIACNPNSTVSSIPPVPPPPPPRPPHPPITAKTIEAVGEYIETQCGEINVTVVEKAFENYTIEDIINYIETNKVVEDFLQNHSFTNLDEVKNTLASNQRYDFLQMLYESSQYEQYLKDVVPQLRVNKTSCTFFKNIPGTNCNYRCLVVTGTENTVRFLCKEDISLNIICVGGGGGGGGSYLNYEWTIYSYCGGGGAGGNTCIAKNIVAQQDTLYEINVGGGGGLYYSGGSTQVYSPQGGILLQASGGGCGDKNKEGVCGDVLTSSSGIYNINGGNGGGGLYENTLVNSTIGSSVSTSITTYLPSFQYILNYFDVSSNNFSILINDVICPNIIQNIYGGGGGGGGGYTINNSDKSVIFGNIGSPGNNGIGGNNGVENTDINGFKFLDSSACSIGSGGGGAGFGMYYPSEIATPGTGGQGLVIIYWEISKTNQEEAENRIKENLETIVENIEENIKKFN